MPTKMYIMRLYSLSTRRLLIPMLVLSMSAIGFVPQVSTCSLVSGAANLLKAPGQSATCCRLAKPCSNSPMRCSCSCCTSGGQCCCGIACHCTPPAHGGPISVPPTPSTSDYGFNLLVNSCIDAVVCEVSHTGWHTDAFVSGDSLEVLTLQHQHVRIQT